MELFHKPKVYGFGITLCLVIGAIFFAIKKTDSVPAEHKIHISYGISVHNPTNQAINNVKIEVKGPITTTAFQRRTHINSDHPFKSSADEFDQGLRFEWDLFPPFTTKNVTVRSDIDLWKEPRKLAKSDLATFMKPEPFIESDHAKIKDLAGQLKAETTLKTIQRTFEWVSQKVVYIGYVKRTRGALYALNYQKGDCTEYACLFTALCRANGIPARVIGGFVCPNNMVLDLGEYHNWAEFFHDGRWHIADPQRKKLMSEQDTYIAFNIGQLEGEASFVVSGIKGDGLIVKLNN